MRQRTAAAAALLLALAGCAGCDSVPDEAVTDCNAEVAAGGAATDILFVVDDSGSMNGEQAELAANLATFIDQLLGSAVKLDVRVAVTDTSVSRFDASVDPSGATTFAGGLMAGKPYPQGTVVAVLDPDGVVTPGLLGYDPALYGTRDGGWGGRRILSSGALDAAVLKRTFKTNVRLGTSGSGKEQPLRALRLALEKATDPLGPNFGLLRAGARLAIVVITDEDDCSESAAPFNGTTDGNCKSPTVKATQLDPLSDYVAAVDSITQLSGSPPIVAVVAGFDTAAPFDPTGCNTNGSASADDPVRLDDFLTLLDATHPGRTYKDSICNDFGASLVQLASMIIPQTMPLQRAPQDWRLMAVQVARANGALQGCRMEEAGTPGAAGADVVFTPPRSGALASLTFQNGCRLGLGDKVELNVVCVR